MPIACKATTLMNQRLCGVSVPLSLTRGRDPGRIEKKDPARRARPTEALVYGIMR
jgi:hypothetical protein